MAANHRDVLVEMAERLEPLPAGTPQRDTALANDARSWAQAIAWLPGTKESTHFAERWTALNQQLEPLLNEVDFPLGPDEQLAGRPAVDARQRAPGARYAE